MRRAYLIPKMVGIGYALFLFMAKMKRTFSYYPHKDELPDLYEELKSKALELGELIGTLEDDDLLIQVQKKGKVVFAQRMKAEVDHPGAKSAPTLLTKEGEEKVNTNTGEIYG